MKDEFNSKTATQTQVMCGKCKLPVVNKSCGCPDVVYVKIRRSGIGI
jgi:hypothetical protein